MFSSFATIDHMGHFRKILTQIFKSGWFSWFTFGPTFNPLFLLMMVKTEKKQAVVRKNVI